VLSLLRTVTSQSQVGCSWQNSAPGKLLTSQRLARADALSWAQVLQVSSASLCEFSSGTQIEEAGTIRGWPCPRLRTETPGKKSRSMQLHLLLCGVAHVRFAHLLLFKASLVTKFNVTGACYEIRTSLER
ncbi:unnamed protein product, partial [Rangifer tarandus platyrhynchus]